MQIPSLRTNAAAITPRAHNTPVLVSFVLQIIPVCPEFTPRRPLFHIDVLRERVCTRVQTKAGLLSFFLQVTRYNATLILTSAIMMASLRVMHYCFRSRRSASAMPI
jgi:hypothetical protein